MPKYEWSLNATHYSSEYGTFSPMKSPLIYKEHRTTRQTDSGKQPQLNIQGMYIYT